MSTPLDSDAMVALRRLRRHLTWWRLLAVAGFALALAVLVREGDVLPPEEHVARVFVEGVIVKDEAFIAMLDDIGDDDTAKALIVDIVSPGGTFTGGEAVFKALRRVAEEKPVVAVMGELATSGGYMAAVGADRIYAGRGTITGSIGVLMQSADVTGLLDKLGIKPETIKSGDAKAVPNPMESLGDKERQQLQGVIDELHLQFLEMVADRRDVSVARLREVAGDGRIMTGATAVDSGLVDGIGDLRDARTWLEDSHQISEDVPLIDWEIEDPIAFLRQQAETLVAAIFGKSLLSERLRLDGIQALWQPSLGAGR